MDKILFGLYNKHSEINDKECLEAGECPPNTISLTLIPDCSVDYVEVKRNQFPMENNYHGWYALVPIGLKPVGVSEGLKLMGVVENNISPIQPADVKMKGATVVVDDVEYEVYGYFGIAKTSNNWKLRLNFRK